MMLQRRMVYSLAVTILVLGWALVASELEARDEEQSSPVNVMPDPPDLGFETRPNAGVANAWGYRERPIGPEKEAGVIRVAVLGDSVTHGGIVSEGELYTRVLESGLHALGRRDIHVLNFSAPGQDIGSLAAMMRYRVSQWKPDLVVYGYYVNDALRTRIVSVSGRPVWVAHDERPFRVVQPTLDAWLHPRSAMFRRFEGAVGARWLATHHPDGSLDWAFYARQFDELIAATRDVGAGLLVYGIPPHVLVEPDPGRCAASVGGGADFCTVNEAYVHRALDIARERGIATANGVDAYRAGPPANLYGNLGDPHHPGAEGHRRLGEGLVAPVLAQLGPASD